jgi:hypothetical protein
MVGTSSASHLASAQASRSRNRLARLRNSFGKQVRQSSVRATIRLPDKKIKKKLAGAIVL